VVDIRRRGSGFLRGFAKQVVPMPALSPTMTQGVIAEWLKKEGEKIKSGDVVAKIETDKATVDFEATDDSWLAKILKPGGEVKVGEPIMVTCDEESEVAGLKNFVVTSKVSRVKNLLFQDPVRSLSHLTFPPPAPILSLQVSTTVPARDLEAGAAGLACSGLRSVGDPFDTEPIQKEGGAPVDVSNLPLSSIFPSARALLLNTHTPKAPKGSGKGGRITKGDVLVMLGKLPATAIASVNLASSPPASILSAPAKSTTAAAAKHSSDAVVAAPALPSPRAGARTHKDVKPSTIRKVIAARLTESKAQTPHAYATVDASIDALLALRVKLKEAGVNVSVNDMVIAAAAKALRVVPEANAYYDAKSGCVKGNSSVDVSVAVATDGGLITPIVKGADTLSLASINAKVKDLAGRARVNKLKPEEFQGGSFTISNLGMFPSINEFSAVINPPQACILAVGKGEQRVMPPSTLGGQPYVATRMSLQLSSDARVVEGHIAGQFLQALRAYLEDPTLLVIDKF